MQHPGWRLGLLALLTSAPADAGELTADSERRVQIAALTTGYAFAALQTGILVSSLTKGRSLDRNWVGGGLLSSITLVGSATGYSVLAAQARDPDQRATFALAAVPGFLIGGLLLATSIDGASNGRGDVFMDQGPALVSLIHGLSLAVLGSVLVIGANSGSSDLSKVGPIYSWAVGGSVLAGYSVVSLFN